ncbi:lantibiotic dehydratase [Pedobacter sp. GR22-10]|uniref:lantibiotic dehydratase n=1 Tax=Pedobacter sp. GR22-10 TaxID=2994472 RepID=UPI0022455755|nr:lantibiotic dehydratase [Pedobacter sp. GR22-10]MCX2432961.1 lantibiotic dehydratase [Pedobacter sp. GR22-10]
MKNILNPSKQLDKNPSGHFLYDFCIVRTPTFPIERAIKLNNDLSMYEKMEDQTIAREMLKEHFSNREFVKALFFASEEVYGLMLSWLEGKELDKKKTDKLMLTLHKYYSRMCTRSTPYGLFAACSYSTISEKSTIMDFTDAIPRQINRFSMDFINDFVSGIWKFQDIRKKMIFYTNTSLYEAGEKYIYTEAKSNKSSVGYALSAIKKTAFTENIIKISQNGASYQDIVSCLTPSGATVEQIDFFIEDLLKEQVLVSEFLPKVTHPGYVNEMLTRLKGLGLSADIMIPLEEVAHTFSKDSPTILELSGAKKTLSDLISRNTEAFQTDLFLDSQTLNLKNSVIEEIAETSYILQKTCQNAVSKNLDEFKKKFSLRYEGREVPLTEALDPNIGVGYGLIVNGNTEAMPLLNGIVFSSSTTTNSKEDYHPLNKLVAQKAKFFFQNKTQVIKLTDAELDEVILENPEEPSFRSSAYIFGSIISDSPESIDRGEFKFNIIQKHSPKVGKLFTRFAFGDKRINDYVIRMADDEQKANPDVILAEVAYLPERSMANLVLRPTLREYEIPFLSRSNTTAENIININDLYVSIRNNRVILRSRKLQKQVVPQCTTPYNSKKGQIIYRFLADVEMQNFKNNFYWPWGQYTNEPFLPRIEYKKLIVSRARWIIKSNLTRGFTKEQTTEFIKEWVVKQNVPRYVNLSLGGDNELFIDLSNSFGLQHICNYTKLGDVLLYEVVHMPENCPTKSGLGSFVNEIIIPLGQREKFSSVLSNSIIANTELVQRTFIPGSEWFYLRIYGSNKTLEKILTNIIFPICNKATEEKLIDKWFFIRYYDPEGHLRVRLHSSSQNLKLGSLLLEFQQKLHQYTATGEIKSISIDTYVREIERYGNTTITNVESLFFNDSLAVCNFIRECYSKNLNIEEERWKAAVVSIEVLFKDFALTISERHSIVEQLNASFFNEFSGRDPIQQSRLERNLNDKFRDMRHLVTETLNANTEQQLTETIFSSRSELNRLIVDRIKHQLGYESITLSELLKSLIHMSLNRIFLTKQRNHELVIYHLMLKHYKSLIARENKQNTQILHN